MYAIDCSVSILNVEIAMSKKILILGAGNFGTCLAQHLASKGCDVTIWARNAKIVFSINSIHKNPVYLTSIELDKRIRAVESLEGEDKAFDAVVIAIPTQFMRGVLEQVKPCLSDQLIVSAAKGIEMKSLEFPLAIIGEVLGKTAEQNAVVLSGPSFASEVVICQPTAVSLGSYSRSRCYEAQEIFHSPYFRAYTSCDPVGLETAGALKNVIAIAAGVCLGMGFQQNSQAALLTRGMAEVTRVGVALGADPISFNGLGGIGDLFLTCTSRKSRNFTVGYRLGQGESLEAIMSSMGSVAEGVTTTKAAQSLVERLGVSAPIINEVYQVLYQQKNIVKAVEDLIHRDAKPEIDLPV